MELNVWQQVKAWYILIIANEPSERRCSDGEAAAE